MPNFSKLLQAVETISVENYRTFTLNWKVEAKEEIVGF
jgi:hypothetical protein